MATILSAPASASLIESPTMVKSVTYTSDGIYNSSSLQHICELYVWEGGKGDQPATPSYTLRKFPILQSNTYKTCGFDVSPIISSFMSASILDVYKDDANNTKWWTVNIYEQAVSGSTTITGSHATLSQPRIAREGYNLWGEKTDLTGGSISGSLSTFPPRFPFLTTAPDFQEIYRTDIPFYFSVYARHDGDLGEPVQYDENITNYLAVGFAGGFQSVNINGTLAQVSSSYVVADEYVTVSNLESMVASGSEYFSIVVRNGSTVIYPSSFIQPYFSCQKKYTPTRIVFRNRFGGFEQFDFNLVSTNTFDVETSTYNRKKLTDSTIYDEGVGNTTYISEGYKTLTVNTDYVSEEWNDFFEGMMLSKEIYLVEPDDGISNYYNTYLGAGFTPLTLQSKNLRLKKEEVDKLIQYTFTFNYAVPHKLKL